MDVSDSEGDIDPDEIVPDHNEFTEQDIELVDLEGHPEVEEPEDNVNSPHHDGESQDSDEEENVSRTSRPRSSRFSRAALDSDEEGTLEGNLTFEYYDGP